MTYKAVNLAACLFLALCVGCASESDDAALNNTNNINNANNSNNSNNGNNVDVLAEDDPRYCGECHEAHYNDWAGSMHAYAAVDPMFQAMLAKGIQETEGKLDQFCIQCHSPMASKYGLTPVEEVNGVSVMPLDMENPLIGRGVVCVTCHKMDGVNATKNADFTVAPMGVLYGPTGNDAAQEAHAIEKSELLVSSTMCGSCHNVVNPKGALLENTFSEWYQSEFADGQGNDDKSCQDCHMPAYQGEIVEGVTKEIHAHTFVGVDIAMVEFPDRERQYQLMEELLRSCVDLRITRTEDEPDAASIRVSMQNINNGHALPSGSTADRQVWVHLVVTDPDGNVVYESGMLDANGDLMDRVDGHSLDPDGDPDLLLYGSFLFGDNDEHVNFPWQAARSQDVLLQPGQTGWREYLIPKAGNEGKRLTATATVNYRTFPPFLVRELKEEGFLPEEQMNDIPIVEMATETFEFVIQ